MICISKIVYKTKYSNRYFIEQPDGSFDGPYTKEQLLNILSEMKKRIL